MPEQHSSGWSPGTPSARSCWTTPTDPADSRLALERPDRLDPAEVELAFVVAQPAPRGQHRPVQAERFDDPGRGLVATVGVRDLDRSVVVDRLSEDVLLLA